MNTLVTLYYLQPVSAAMAELFLATLKTRHPWGHSNLF